MRDTFAEIRAYAEAKKARERAAGPASTNGHVSLAASSGDTAYGMRALAGECEKVATAPEGTRNAVLNTAAFKLGQVIGAGRLSEATALVNLSTAARLTGLEETEIALVLRGNANGALAAGTTRPRTVAERRVTPVVTVAPIDDWSPPAAEPAEEVVDLGALVRAHLPLLDWHALWADETEEEWIVEPLLPARRLVALYSPPKVGKSLLMLEIAVAVSRGTQVLGVVPDRARRVLYVDLENDPKGDVRERLIDMDLGPDDLTDLAYLSFPTLAALDSDRGGAELLAAVVEYACEVVVIDTVSRAVAGEENENDTWLKFYRHTGLRMKQAGIAMIRLDHSGKDETKGQRGGSAKSGDVDAVWRLSRVTEETFQLTCEANRMRVAEKTLVLHREEGPLRHRVDAGGQRAAWDVKLAAVVAAMDAADVPVEAGSTKVRAVVRAAGIRARNDVIRAAIKQRKQRLGGLGTDG